MLSDDTIKRIKALKSKVDEVMKIFDVPEDRAWAIITASDAEKAAHMAEIIDKRQELVIAAELRSLSARAATFKSNVEEKKEA